MRSTLLRRDVMLGLLGAAAGCTGHSGTGSDGQVPATSRISPKRAPAPASTPGTEVVLLVQWSAPVAASSAQLTLYGDGRATLSQSSGFSVANSSFTTAQIDADVVARVRAALGDPQFAGAAASYSQRGVKDGGLASYIGGSRRIAVVNDPADLPDPLARLRDEVRAIRTRLDQDGVDAFTAPDPPLVVDRRATMSADDNDALTVFASGLVVFQVNGGSLPKRAGADDPYPIVHTRRVEPAALVELQAAAQALATADLPEVLAPADDVSTDEGTWHDVWRRGPSLRVLVKPGVPVPDALATMLRETAWLRTLFDAPPDAPG